MGNQPELLALLFKLAQEEQGPVGSAFPRNRLQRLEPLARLGRVLVDGAIRRGAHLVLLHYLLRSLWRDGCPPAAGVRSRRAR